MQEAVEVGEAPGGEPEQKAGAEVEAVQEAMEVGEALQRRKARDDTGRRR